MSTPSSPSQKKDKKKQGKKTSAASAGATPADTNKAKNKTGMDGGEQISMAGFASVKTAA